MTQPRLKAVHPVLPSRDVEASVRFYALLGFTLAFQDRSDAPRYAGVRRDGVELHLQWHDASEWNHPGDRPTYRIVVDDVDRLSADFEKIANLDRTAVRDTSWGTREFHVRDPDKNGLQFYRSL
jgi:catechol 2,3-dioxygenase-like lactoylglutathione lyase family enzyme